MPTTVLAFNLMLFLLPGFITLKVREALTVVAKGSDTSRLIDALLFTLYNYAIYFPVAAALRLNVTLIGATSDVSGAALRISAPSAGALFLMIAVAVLIGVFAGVGAERDWFHRLKTGLRLTSRLARIDIWAETFYQTKGKWVRVHLEDGRQIVGWAYLYSDEPERRQLCLKSAQIRDADGTVQQPLKEDEMVLVTEGNKIRLIEFLRGGEPSEGGT